MKQTHALAVADVAERDAPRCCIAQVHALINLVRARHDLEQAKPCVDETNRTLVEDDLPVPTLHDIHVGELEASLLTDCSHAFDSSEVEIRHDDPGELAHVRVVFALTWLVPLMLVSATLTLFGATLDQALNSLLWFSMFAMAVPLSGSLVALLLHTSQRKRNFGAVSETISRSEQA